MAKEEIPRGQLSLIILSTLADNDKYGYEIIELIKEKTNGKLNIKQPSLYSSLRRMQEQGLISSYWRDSDIGGRRHYYSITDYGKKYSEKWQADWDNNFENEIQDEKLESPEVEQQQSTTTTIVLQQGSLFSDFDNDTQKTSSSNNDQPENLQDDNSVQYDLFSMQYNEVKDDNSTQVNSLTTLRQEADNKEHDEVSESMISNLRNLGQSEKTNNDNQSQPIDIHKTYFELKRRQKSFTESMKEEHDDNYIEPIKSFENEEKVVDNSPSPAIADEQTQVESNIVDDYVDESFKDEEEYVETYSETENDFETSTEFIDLNNLNFDKPIVQNDFQEDVDEPFEETINEPETNNDDLATDNESQEYTKEVVQDQVETAVEQKEIKYPETHDDAIYITERLNYDTIPKVKRIEPNRFENFATNSNSDFDKKLTQIYENKQYKEDNGTKTEPMYDSKYDYQKPEKYVYEEPINTVNQNRAEFEDMKKNYNNLGDLKRYYATQKVKFCIHQKQDKTLDSFKYANLNKLNLFSFGAISILCILESLIMFLCVGKFQPTWNWLYLFVPIMFLVAESYFVFCYLKNKNKLIKKTSVINNNWIYNVISFVIFSMFVFSINLLCGMTFDSISYFATTFIYLVLIGLNYPLLFVSKYIFIKSNLV